MSERKTTEIKLRVSPDEKTSWQLAAEQREVGLSQFIRECVEDVLQIEQNQRLDSTLLVNNAIALLKGDSTPEDEDSSVALEDAFPATPWAPYTIPAGTVVSNGPVCEGDVVRNHITGEIIRVTPASDPVPTSGEADLVDVLGPVIAAEVSGEEPKPWTFEARKRD